MKNKLIIFGIAAAMLVSCGMTSTADSSGTAEMVDYNFTITNTMSNGIKGLCLGLDGEKDVKTNYKGKATISAPKDKAMELSITNLGGYIFDGFTTEVGKYDYELTLHSVPNKGEIQTTTSIGIGDNVYDFTLERDDGVNVNLTEAMKGKKGAIINCWYIDCQYCQVEFPHLNEEYPALKDDYAFFALSHLNDIPAIKNYKDKNGYDNLDFYSDNIGYIRSLGVSGFPTTILINPEGLIVAEESECFTNGAFTKFVTTNLK